MKAFVESRRHMKRLLGLVLGALVVGRPCWPSRGDNRYDIIHIWIQPPHYVRPGPLPVFRSANFPCVRVWPNRRSPASSLVG